MMNRDQFLAMRLDAEAVFADLYLIDTTTLDKPQLEQHKNSMAAAYLALVNLENAQFENLLGKVKVQLLELAGAMQALQEGIRGLKSAPAKLDFIAKGMGTLATVVQVLS